MLCNAIDCYGHRYESTKDDDRFTLLPEEGFIYGPSGPRLFLRVGERSPLGIFTARGQRPLVGFPHKYSGLVWSRSKWGEGKLLRAIVEYNWLYWDDEGKPKQLRKEVTNSTN